MFSSLNKRRLLSLGLSLAILSGCTSVDWVSPKSTRSAPPTKPARTPMPTA